MKFATREELYRFLNNFDWESKKDHPFSSVYFLVKCEDFVGPVYFYKYEDCWFESPCTISYMPLEDNKLREYIEELYEKDSWDQAYQYESLFQRDNIHYTIDSPQCSLFLSENIEIAQVMTETECLNFFMLLIHKQ